ncbi:MFS transporter [Neisseria sp. Ec49-e6-T10]|uniref:MFS transporter n=1 Tax=Neisseria sp. Ec49-e6-T10 TaxID=3140744 RepID=UPI003EBD5A10
MENVALKESEPVDDKPANSAARVAIASFVGTAVEFYDFYIYGLAAALIIGPVFFPQADASAQALSSFATFGIAFLARPIGSALFGHFGDKLGRKTTLVASLMIMGLSTFLIGFLPGYATIGFWAPLILCILRMGQGLGLGGEWGGAALLATENAPKGKRAIFGMFPQLGPPIGFVMACGIFLLLNIVLTETQFFAWGWRIPFLVSIVLVGVGLYVRLNIVESTNFTKMKQTNNHVNVPVLDTIRYHFKALVLGSFAMVSCYVLFFLITVFSLQYGTAHLGFSKSQYLEMLCIAIVFMAIATPISAYLSDHYGRRPVLLVGTAATFIVGYLYGPMLNAGDYLETVIYLSLALFVMGFTFSPMGALLPEIFPTNVRYTGSSATYNIGGILGGSVTPFFAAKLVAAGGLNYVGWYLCLGAVVSFLAVALLHETKHEDFMK